jgi:phenylalanyl-tRNA synthetase beta chain
LSREIDLVEEVARLYGYDKLPAGQSVTHQVVGASAQDRARSELRDVLAAAGFDEAVCHGFLDEGEAELFGYDRGVHVDPRVRKTNNLLRPTLLPSLLRACKSNQDAGNTGVRLYELAAVFPAGQGQLPDEHTELALVSEGDLPLVRGALERIVERLTGQGRLAVEPVEVAGLEVGSAGKVTLDGKPVGVLGMTSRQAMDYYGMEKPLAVAAAALEPLLAAARTVRQYQPLPRFPGVRRDLSVVVDQAVRWSRLEQAVRDCRQNELQALEYVDTYTGKQLPPGKKSVTLSLVYRSEEGTLRSEQVDQLVAQVVAALGQELSATLRT